MLTRRDLLQEIAKLEGQTFKQATHKYGSMRRAELEVVIRDLEAAGAAQVPDKGKVYAVWLTEEQIHLLGTLCNEVTEEQREWIRNEPGSASDGEMNAASEYADDTAELALVFQKAYDVITGD